MKVLLVDDEQVVLTVSKEALADIAHDVHTCLDPRAALERDLKSFDVILSDFYMPGMQGDEFLGEVRKGAPDVPFIFLTQNEDLGIAVELIRQGADDYISKPINPTSFVFRIQKVIEEKERELRIRQISEEQRLIELERRKLANWRVLYASKDAYQTEKLLSNLSRSINQGGGFLWLDLLSSSLADSDEENYAVPKPVMEMAVEAARNLETLLNQVTYIGTLEETELALQPLSGAGFHSTLERIVSEHILPVLKNHERPLRWNSVPPKLPPGATVRVDVDRIADILLELTVNAVKYSPPATSVMIDLVHESENGTEMLTLQVSSIARRLEATDDEGKHIYGIPYDYREQVFDLYSSIEAFPEYLAEEKWTDGSGLYIARKLMKLMGGWILAHSGMDHTSAPPQPLVRIDVRIPVFHDES